MNKSLQRSARSELAGPSIPAEISFSKPHPEHKPIFNPTSFAGVSSVHVDIITICKLALGVNVTEGQS